MNCITRPASILTFADPLFSLYAQVDWNNPHNIISQNRLILFSWIDLMESWVIDTQADAEIYACLQHTDALVPLLPCYQRLAKVAKSMWVFGAPERGDLTPPGLALNCVTLNSADRLYDEWFLLIRHADFTRALVARETGSGQCSGVYVTDAPQVEPLYHRLAQSVGL